MNKVQQTWSLPASCVNCIGGVCNVSEADREDVKFRSTLDMASSGSQRHGKSMYHLTSLSSHRLHQLSHSPHLRSLICWRIEQWTAVWRESIVCSRKISLCAQNRTSWHQCTVHSTAHILLPPSPTWSNCQWAKPSSGEPFSLTPLSHGLSEGSPAGTVTALRAARDRYNGVIRKLKCTGRVQVISLLEFPFLDVMDMWDNRTKGSQKLLWIEGVNGIFCGKLHRSVTVLRVKSQGRIYQIPR